MSLELIVDIWDGLRSHINYTERKEAADMLINILIDNDYEVQEIKDSFKGDKDIAAALKYYAEQHDTEEEYDEESDEEDDDEY